PHGRHQVDGDARAPAVLIALLAERRRIVHQNVDAAECRSRILDVARDRVGVGEVAYRRMNRPADRGKLGPRFLDAFRPAGAHRDPGAGLRERQRNGAPDATAAARNHDPPSAEIKCHESLPPAVLPGRPIDPRVVRCKSTGGLSELATNRWLEFDELLWGPLGSGERCRSDKPVRLPTRHAARASKSSWLRSSSRPRPPPVRCWVRPAPGRCITPGNIYRSAIRRRSKPSSSAKPA